MADGQVTRRGLVQRDTVAMGAAVLQGWQMINKLDEVRRRYGRKVNVKIKHVEAWGLLESLAPEVSIPAVLKEFDLETSSQMLATNTSLQNAKRPPSGAS